MKKEKMDKLNVTKEAKELVSDIQSGKVLSSLGQQPTIPETQGEMAAKETALNGGVEDRAEPSASPPTPTQQPPPVTEPLQDEEEKAAKEASVEVEQDTSKPVPPLTSAFTVSGPIQDQGRKALAVTLTQEIKDHLRSAQRIIWRMHKEKLWEELGYYSFGEYILVEFIHKRNWGYKQITLVKAADALEAKGIVNPLANLSPEAAQVFRKWENRPEVFTLAYQQIVERDEKPTQARLAAECEVQNDYLLETELTPGLTQEEYQAWNKIELPKPFGLDNEYATTESLLSECKRQRGKPPLKRITKLVRGDDLLSFVKELEPVAVDLAKLKEIDAEIEKLNQGIDAKSDAIEAKIEKLRKNKKSSAAIKELEEEKAKLEEEKAQLEKQLEQEKEEEGEEDGDNPPGCKPKDQEEYPDDADKQALWQELKEGPGLFLDDLVRRLQVAADQFLLLQKDVDLLEPLMDRLDNALTRLKENLKDEEPQTVKEALADDVNQ
jgi:hypothetical protein